MALKLVTGAPGWLGTRLVESLVQGLPDVDAFAHPDPQVQIRCLVQPGMDCQVLRQISSQIEIVPGDILDSAALGKFFRAAAGATLYHCAGIVHPKRWIREYYRVNLAGTRALLTSAERAQVRRVIVVSSISPMGFSYRADEIFDESRDYHPYMNYGRSKMMMERVVHEFQARGKLQTVVVRPTWFYGPGQPERQNTFFKMIRRGVAPILGDGTNRRSMTYIDNLVQVMRLGARNEAASGQTYWAADRHAYSVSEIVDTVEQLMEHEFGLPVAHKRLRLPFIVGQAAMWTD